MKKILLPLIFSCISITGLFAQQRYVDEVFTNFTQQNNVVYSTNLSVIAASQGLPYVPTGFNASVPALAFDLYEPTGDTIAERPLIIMLHTGTFLPIIYNGNPTGMRNDVATTEICKSYAKRGYVVANLEYRLGWNPYALTQAERAASLMKAVYRAIQDTKSAVRFFRKDYATNGNQWGIDTSRIILCGQGSGGWVALGYATVDKLPELQLPKFLDEVGTPLIDTAVIGDWNGYGGNSIPGQGNMVSNLGYSNDIHMVCSMGGGIGDLSWLEAGDVPMCAVHCPTDPVATYTTGDVSIASIGLVTTEISGSYDVMKKANLLGNNDVLNETNACSDPYTTAAAAASANAEGMPIATAPLLENQIVGEPVDNVFPFITGNLNEASPWDFWDSTMTVNIALAMNLPAAQGTAAHVSSLAQNPNMSFSKSRYYIDSTLGYFCRRIVQVTNLNGAIPTNVIACDSYTANGETYSTSGTYSGTIDCNSYILNLTITPSSTNTTTESACDSYFWNGTTYTSSGIYTGMTDNCVTESLDLTITPSTTNTTTESACGSFLWNGTTYSTSGVYTGTTANCVTQSLNITITPSTTNTTAASECDSYSWNGETYTESGIYTGMTDNCVTESLNLTITTSSTNTTLVNTCESYTWNGQTYDSSGVYTGTTANCVTESLDLTVTPGSINSTTISACGTYSWNGTTYNASGTYAGDTTNCGVDLLILTIVPSSTNTTTIISCDTYIWNGQTYDSSGVYTGTTANCVTQYLDLTITPSSTNTTTASACGSYSWNGETQTSSGIYTGTTTNCVTETLDLTITPNTTNTTDTTVCDSYSWNGQTYTTSGTYTGTTTDCVTESLNLTINVTPAAAVVTALDGVLTATGGGAGLGLWVDCATQQPILGAMGTTFTPTANGIYTYVILNATMSCFGIGNCVEVTDVSLDENDEVLFSIAPNPSNGIFTLKNPSLIDGTLVITDGSGRIIYESSIDASDKSIDISTASTGIYYLKIKSDNNNKVIRLIKN